MTKVDQMNATSANSRHTIIVIEDENVVLKTLIRLLSRTYDVQGASSLSEAEGLMRISTPSAVLCDLHLGDAGPEGIVASLNSMSMSQRTVFMSGGAFAASDEYSFEQLPGPLLHKPFDPASLRAILAQVIAQV